VIDLREANPVPDEQATGWSRSPEGLVTRARIALSGPAGALRRRSRGLTVAAAAALVLALVASVLVLRTAGDRSTPAAGSMIERLAHGTWKHLPAGPASGLGDPRTVWTGRELIVWGDRVPPARSEGFAFDPRTGRWRALAASPLGVVTGAVVRWTGTEMLVWGGSDSSGLTEVVSSGGAAYDPATDSWRSMSSAPFFPNGRTTATWTGAELVVTSDTGRVASYDPSTDRWASLPPAPISLDDARVRASWNGRRVVFVAPVAAGGAVAFDPATSAWSRLPLPFGNAQPFTVGLAWSGRDLVYVEWFGASDELRWARLAGDRWVPGPRALRHPFICGADTTPVPGGVVVSCSGSEELGLDSKSWRSLPRPPAGTFAPAAWTGRELIALAFTGRQLLALEPAAK
jgi:hypothetical protein